MKSTKVKIRPAARHIFAIGRDLIQNSIAAIVELVKNSYDADSQKVDILFEKLNDNKLVIIIKDSGHGMSYNTVLNKWMVPSTDDKLKRRYSPGGRLMQGRKGIGRYAVSILGDKFYMETIDISGEKTYLNIDWDDFELDNDKVKFLDDVSVDIYREDVEGNSGTLLKIFGNEKYLNEWTENNLKILIGELRKLTSPLDISWDENESFTIDVSFKNFDYSDYNNNTINITPYEILDYWDYRLTGSIEKVRVDKINPDDFIQKNKLNNLINKISQNNEENNQYLVIANYSYYNNLSKEEEFYKDAIEFDKGKYCGNIHFDLRVFDREPEAIDVLIKRGLKDPLTNQFVGRRDAKRLLNEMCGVRIYKAGFRIRPYGDPGHDWLKLDTSRVQDPSKRIGINQIIGSITIESEEGSNLEEKSARDGLKENIYYNGLVEVIHKTIEELEVFRYDFRKKTGRGRVTTTLENTLNKAFNNDELKKKIKSTLKKKDVEEEDIDEVVELIDKADKKKQYLLEDIRETIAKYEGHVTLGKIIMVVMHEGARPLAYFNNQIPLLEEYIDDIKRNYSEVLLDNIKGILRDIAEQTEFFVSLFKRLRHLSIKKRKKVIFKLNETINQTIKIYDCEIKNNNILLKYNCNENIELLGWKEDFYITFTNLFDNSIYWLLKSYKEEKFIEINISDNENDIVIDFIDNGVGIEKRYIEDNKIFEPGFSTKSDGTGLGLAITGEAITRNNGTIKAIYSEDGAYFRIELNLKGDSDE